MIIFGWGHTKREDLGAVMPLKCPKCNNTKFWHLRKQSTWFTLFFMPVFPYEKNKWLSCPICNSGIQLSNDQVERATELIEITNDYLNKYITEENYLSQVKEMKLLN